MIFQAGKSLPSPEALHRLFKYDASTGDLIWRRRQPQDFVPGKQSAEQKSAAWNGKFSGKAAGTVASCNGYVYVSVSGKKLLAHRVIVAMRDRAWPKLQIDHINGCRDDNRASNLRLVSPSDNAKNAARKSAGKSGVTGVYPISGSQKWKAVIGDSRSQLYLGCFSTISEAAFARKEAEARLGYSERHGA